MDQEPLDMRHERQVGRGDVVGGDEQDVGALGRSRGVVPVHGAG